jgi:hypothetical protein
MCAGRRRGAAKARWGWSGVAPFTAAQLAPSDVDLGVLLPGHQSPIERIVLVLRDLGGKYHCYLHQDELGPTRAERMAALRLLLDQFGPLLSRLNGLPGHLRLWLSKQLVFCLRPIEHHVDDFEAYSNDEEAVQLVGEAAINYGRMSGPASTTGDAKLMDDLGGAAEKARELLSALDTTTAGAVVIVWPRLEFDGGAESDLTSFAIVCARIERLRRRAELTLAGLERRRGAERSESLRWLVWQLCDLYHHETGLPVTSSAVANNHYKSRPESPAGRFVLAAAAALRPSEAWAREHHHWVIGKRAHVLDKGGLERAVYFAMREYVARHSSSSGRRGRWKWVE